MPEHHDEQVTLDDLRNRLAKASSVLGSQVYTYWEAYPSPVAQALHQAFHEAWGGPTVPLDLYATSPIWEAQAEAVERIVAERLTAVEALHQGMHHCGSDWWTDNPTYRGSIANKGLCPTRRALRIRPGLPHTTATDDGATT